jgi:dTDP-glucose 4,6-dehydratase
VTVFVTGGAGFIGSALVRALIAAGERVVNIDKLTYAGSLDNLAEAARHPAHRFVKADVNELATLRELFRAERPGAVYHLAAESHVDRSIDDPDSFVRANVNGTATLLQAALEHWRGLEGERRARFRYLQVSTDEVYGELGAEGFFDEHSPYRPSSPYSASKAAADHLARAWHRTFGLPAMVSNCSNNYGPYQFPEKLIPLVTLNALEGKPLPVYGKGEQVRDWLYVDDHATALRAIVERGRAGETYLVGARCERRNIDLVRELCAVLDALHPEGRPHDGLIRFVADRPGHDARYAIDPGKLERELGWRPATPFADGLRRTVSWYLEHRGWCQAGHLRYGRQRLGLQRAAS